MKLSDLIAAIGDENVSFQNINNCLSGVKVGKKDSRIEFFTSTVNGRSLAKSAALGDPCGITGLVVWVPTEKMKAAIDSDESTEAARAKAAEGK